MVCGNPPRAKPKTAQKKREAFDSIYANTAVAANAKTKTKAASKDDTAAPWWAKRQKESRPTGHSAQKRQQMRAQAGGSAKGGKPCCPECGKQGHVQGQVAQGQNSEGVGQKQERRLTTGASEEIAVLSARVARGLLMLIGNLGTAEGNTGANRERTARWWRSVNRLLDTAHRMHKLSDGRFPPESALRQWSTLLSGLGAEVGVAFGAREQREAAFNMLAIMVPTFRTSLSASALLDAPEVSGAIDSALLAASDRVLYRFLEGERRRTRLELAAIGGLESALVCEAYGGSATGVCGSGQLQPPMPDELAVVNKIQPHALKYGGGDDDELPASWGALLKGLVKVELDPSSGDITWIKDTTSESCGKFYGYSGFLAGELYVELVSLFSSTSSYTGQDLNDRVACIKTLIAKKLNP